MRTDRARTWLWVGAALSLFALHHEYDLPVAAWLYSIFLLRYLRMRPVRDGVTRIFAVMLAGSVVWLCMTALVAAPRAIGAFLVLALLLTVPFLLDRLLARPLARNHALVATLVFPSARAGCELLFTLVTGFGNFGSLAATQHDQLELLQIASVTGSYGVSFLVAWLASVVNHAWDADFAWARSRRVLLTYGAVLGAVLAGGAMRLYWMPPAEATIRVAGISPSRAALAARRAQRSPAPVNDDLVARTEQEARAGARIVLWSESAALVTAETRGPLIERVAALARAHGVYVEMALEMEGEQPTNEAVLVRPDGEVAWTYHKSHLTPAEAAYGIAPGTGVAPTLATPETKLATVICYDLDYPSLVAGSAARGADILLVPANDWPGIINMHSQKAVLRAIESGQSILRQSSHGIGTALDPQGRTLARSHFYSSEAQTTVAYLPVRGRWTVYSRVGDAFGWLCVAAMAAALLWSRKVLSSRDGSHS
jgi:apolipoprotein N-acyltransferase